MSSNNSVGISSSLKTDGLDLVTVTVNENGLDLLFGLLTSSYFLRRDFLQRYTSKVKRMTDYVAYFGANN